jgi:hypothetical protein
METLPLQENFNSSQFIILLKLNSRKMKDSQLKTILSIAFSSMLIPGLVLSQTFEEYKKQQEQEFKDYKEKEAKAFDDFKKAYFKGMAELDQQWQGYLKEGWIDFDLATGEKEPDDPKPDTPPKFQKLEPMDLVVGNFSTEEEQPKAIILPLNYGKPKPVTSTKSMNFPYYGGSVDLAYPSDYGFTGNLEINEDFTSVFWEQQAKKNYLDLVNQLLNYKEKWSLNDYGYLMLVDKAADNLSAGNANLKALHTWFLLLKSKYGAKIGARQGRFDLFVPVDHAIYEMPYLNYEGNQYFPVSALKGEKVNGELGFSSQGKEFPGSYKILNLGFSRPLNLPLKAVSKNFKFSFDGKEYDVPLTYNANEIDFFKNYPTCEIGVYINSFMSVQTRESLMEFFDPVFKYRNELERAGLMLRFAQTAFGYQVDQEQFGREKWFFPTEILYYPNSDCDDRAIFYARLVTELMGNKVVAVDYPGHVATAVKFNSTVRGDFVTYQKEDLFICDPTYVNGPIGATMPQFRTKAQGIYPVVGATPASYSVVETLPEGELWTMSEYKGIDYSISLKQNLNKPTELWVFKAGLDKKVIWQSKIEIKDTLGSSGLAIRLDENGNVLGTVGFNEAESYGDYGVNVVENSPVVIYEAGAVYQEEGAGDFFKKADSYSADFRTNNVDREMAAFLGFIAALAVRDQSMSMSEVMDEVNKRNPGTRKKYPETFDAISTLKLIRTKSNIFEIRLGAGKSSLTLDKLKVLEGARFRLVRYPSNNVKMEIVNGLSVGKAFIRFDLNYIKVLAQKKELVFNYGSDGSNAVVKFDDLLF